ncbi:MAG: cysteine--tRNA ligase [Candidatus Pacearchaeota archaeon]|nr:cysteine--tRNA ligase [Candidatus Pacearchaeota archaeon]
MLKLYNTLTRKKETFKPIKKQLVKMYSCGPTVYNYAHIGNLRTYIFNDLLKRVLLYNKYKVKHAMNITDVDDKIIKKCNEEKISLKELTSKYEKAFFSDIEELNIIKPSCILRATETIKEIVSLIKILMKKGYAYQSQDGIYFSISKFKNYGKLALLEKIKTTKERINKDEYSKENPQDFALWKFYKEEDGNVFWETEIGKGRPGWHIECSAMSIKCLGKSFDIHTGAIDLIFPHHTNEIAQSEAATGKKFVNYWIHGAHLTLKDEKMAKSAGNTIYLSNLKEKGFNPIIFRYLCLQNHYRSPMSFSFDNLEAAKSSYERIKRKIIILKKEHAKLNDKTKIYEKQFLEAINDDLNMPLALQVFYKALDDIDFSSEKKLKLLEKFDEVFGLGIKDIKEEKLSIPEEINKLIKQREKLREEKNFKEADKIREMIRQKGFLLEDSPEGTKIQKI